MAETEYLTIAQVGALFGMNSKTIREWVRLRRFPAPTQIGHTKFWKRTDITRFFDAVKLVEEVTGVSVFGNSPDVLGTSGEIVEPTPSKRKKQD